MFLAAVTNPQLHGGHEANEYVKDVWHNLTLHWDRLAVCLIVAIAVTFLAGRRIDAKSDVAFKRFLGQIAGVSMIPVAFGAFAIAWWIYSNIVSYPATLLGALAPIHNIGDYGHGLYWLVIPVGLALALAVFDRVRSIWKWPAIPSAFIGVTAITNLIVVIVELGKVYFGQ